MPMNAIEKLGVWVNIYCYSFPERISLAQQSEKLGYGAIWIPDMAGEDPFVTVAALAAETSEIKLATGIANIYIRSPLAMAGSRSALNKLSGDRLILGLGVSHKEIVSGWLKMDYGKPLSTMSLYLDALKPLVTDPENGMIVLAALREKMLALSAQKSDGAHPYLTTPEHTAKAREIMGPGKFLAPEQKIILETDPSIARAVARKNLAMYLAIVNYRNSFLEFGFNQDDFADGGSDRLIDALVAWGDETKIMKHLEAHWDNGADHVCVQMLRPDGEAGCDPRALEAFAPGN